MILLHRTAHGETCARAVEAARSVSHLWPDARRDHCETAVAFAARVADGEAVPQAEARGWVVTHEHGASGAPAVGCAVSAAVCCAREAGWPGQDWWRVVETEAQRALAWPTAVGGRGVGGI